MNKNPYEDLMASNVGGLFVIVVADEQPTGLRAMNDNRRNWNALDSANKRRRKLRIIAIFTNLSLPSHVDAVRQSCRSELVNANTARLHKEQYKQHMWLNLHTVHFF